MGAPGSTQQDAGEAARVVQQSAAVEALARLGLASRGLVWLVIGLLGLSLVGGGQAQADQQGALRAIAAKPLGEVLLVVLVVGFLGYAVWQALGAAVGHDRGKGRVEAGLKALLYGGLAVSVGRFLGTGQRSGRDQTPSLTARLMEQPGGRWLVVLVGLAVVGLGCHLVLRAWRGTHRRKIESWKVPDGRGRHAVQVGTVGLTGRGLVVALVGAFLVTAGVQADPREARGLDAALHELAQQPYGRVLLAVAVCGLLGYALWSFVEAALHRHEEGAR